MSMGDQRHESHPAEPAVRSDPAPWCSAVHRQADGKERDPGGGEAWAGGGGRMTLAQLSPAVRALGRGQRNCVWPVLLHALSVSRRPQVALVAEQAVYEAQAAAMRAEAERVTGMERGLADERGALSREREALEAARRSAKEEQGKTEVRVEGIWEGRARGLSRARGGWEAAEDEAVHAYGMQAARKAAAADAVRAEARLADATAAEARAAAARARADAQFASVREAGEMAEASRKDLAQVCEGAGAACRAAAGVGSRRRWLCLCRGRRRAHVASGRDALHRMVWLPCSARRRWQRLRPRRSARRCAPRSPPSGQRRPPCQPGCPPAAWPVPRRPCACAAQARADALAAELEAQLAAAVARKHELDAREAALAEQAHKVRAQRAWRWATGRRAAQGWPQDSARGLLRGAGRLC
jgi:hypothetical protein